MNEYDFGEMILPIENIFGVLKTEQRSIYFHLFGHFPKSILADTIKKILLQHNPADRFKQFPTTSEFQEFLKGVLAGTAIASEEDLRCLSRCSVCGDTGWKLIEKEEEFYPNEKSRGMKHEFSLFCSCPKGQMMKRAHRLEIEEACGQKERNTDPSLAYSDEWDEAQGGDVQEISGELKEE